MLGSNCSEHVRAEMYSIDNIPLRCEIELIPSLLELSVHDLFHIKSAFDPTLGIAHLYFSSKTAMFSDLFKRLSCTFTFELKFLSK